MSEAERDKILAVRDDLNAPEGEGRELTHMREEMRDLRQLVSTIAEHLRVPAASEPESPLAALPRPLLVSISLQTGLLLHMRSPPRLLAHAL